MKIIFLKRQCYFSLKGFSIIFSGDENMGNQQINQSLVVCKVLKADNLFQMNYEFVERLNSHYNLAIPLDE